MSTHVGIGSHARRLVALLTLLAALGFHAAPARADEVHVMVSGGFTAPFKVLAAEWEKATGHTVVTVYGASMGSTPTAIPNRLRRGEPADVVILARQALDALATDGAVRAGTQVDLVRSRIAMAVRAGAPVPDISTEAKFRDALLNAPSVAYSDSASGTYISTQMFRRMGIADQLTPKSKMIPGTPVGETVAKGEAAVGFQQLSELKPVDGITIVGPIPESVQLVTLFSAGIATSSKAPAPAQALIQFLVSRQAWETIRNAGLEPVAEAAPPRE